MRSLKNFGAGALIALATAGGASAQISGVVTSRSVSISTLAPDQPGSFYSFNADVPNGNFQYNLDPTYGSVVNVQIAANAANGHIDFANNTTTGGSYATARSSTTVAVTFKNPSLTEALNARLTSSIIPAGLGFYESNPAENHLDNDINHHPEATGEDPYVGGRYNMGSGPRHSVSGTTPYDETLASAGVSFAIQSTSQNGIQTLAEYSADMVLHRVNVLLLATPDAVEHYDFGGVQTMLTLHSNIGGVQQNSVITTDSSDDSRQGILSLRDALSLANFQRVGTDSLLRQVGYQWDTTELTLNLGWLQAQEERTLTYVTSVYANTFLQPWFSNDNLLLAYAGFGDPIGGNAGGGAIEDPDFPLLRLDGLSFDPSNGALTGPTFHNVYEPQSPLQVLTDPVSPFADSGPIGGVPEPTTWALMLGGFGLAGAALRRRARLA